MFKHALAGAILGLCAVPAQAAVVDFIVKGQVVSISPDLTPEGTFGAGTGFTMTLRIDDANPPVLPFDPALPEDRQPVDLFSIEFESGQSASFAPASANEGRIVLINDGPGLFGFEDRVEFFGAPATGGIAFVLASLTDNFGAALSSVSLAELSTLAMGLGAAAFDDPGGSLGLVAGSTAFGVCTPSSTVQTCFNPLTVTSLEVAPVSVSQVPLPMSAPLLLAALGGLAMYRRRTAA